MSRSPSHSRGAPLPRQADVATPTIDELAAGGVKLRSLYTWNWCAPSRGSLLTGRYVPNHGFEDGGDGPDDKGVVRVLPLEFELLPAALRRIANYSTHMVGKVRPDRFLPGWLAGSRAVVVAPGCIGGRGRGDHFTRAGFACALRTSVAPRLRHPSVPSGVARL